MNKPKIDNAIFIITSTTFPCGGAGTMRKTSLGKGFLYHDFKPIIILLSRKNEHLNNPLKGVYENIEYLNSTGFRWRGSKIRKALIQFFAVLNAGIIIIKEAKKHKNKIIWNNNYKLLTNGFFYLVSKLVGAFYITEMNENPYFFLKKKNSKLLFKYKRFKLKYSLKLFDTVFVMTYTLKELLESKNLKLAEIGVVHNTVDHERFINDEPVQIKKTITYTGSLSLEKEGLDVLIEAFAKISDDFPDFTLQICGFSSKIYKNRLKRLIRKHKIEQKVNIILDVPNNKIPGILSESYLLALTRTPNEQTNYGFPTKLVEYLSSGRPVLVTRVSDIPVFLKDNDSAFMPSGYQIKDISEKLKYALNNKEKAALIGLKGKQVAMEKFSYITESKKIINSYQKFMLATKKM